MSHVISLRICKLTADIDCFQNFSYNSRFKRTGYGVEICLEFYFIVFLIVTRDRRSIYLSLSSQLSVALMKTYFHMCTINEQQSYNNKTNKTGKNKTKQNKIQVNAVYYCQFKRCWLKCKLVFDL